MKAKIEDLFPKVGRTDHGIQLLFGEINSNVAAETCAWILEANVVPEEERPKSLILFINSEGGELPAAFAIIECMRGSSVPVQTVALGNICSAGLIIFMNGKKGFRTVTPTCSIMSHNYSTGIIGNHHELLAVQKELNYTHKRILDTYKRCTGLSDKIITEKLIGAQDNWLTPKEAVDFGIADRISGL
jgi:ATP-dependent Clp protease protease subunit